MLHDFADDYTDATLMDLAYSEPPALKRRASPSPISRVKTPKSHSAM